MGETGSEFRETVRIREIKPDWPKMERGRKRGRERGRDTTGVTSPSCAMAAVCQYVPN